MQERTLRAMNTDVRVVTTADGPRGARRLEDAVETFTIYECTLSRFDPASELSALNLAGHRPVHVSPLLWSSLAAARTAFTETAGLYDPAILGALEAAGYDRSFEQLAQLDQHGLVRPTPAPPTASIRCRPKNYPYELSSAACAVHLAPDVRVDLGGIGKGLAVDAAAALLTEQPGFLVDAGGDLRTGGLSPDGGPWGVAVQDPFDPDNDLAVLALTDCAVATSSTARRHWLHADTLQHHLIDPRTGRSATSDIAAATVIATDCATAEVWAKVVVIAGSGAGFTLLEEQMLPGLLIRTDGRIQMNDAMRPFLERGEVELVSPERCEPCRRGS